MTNDIGYIQHGAGTAGPFCTERVAVKNEYGDRWLVRYWGRWRRLHIQVGRTYIVCHGEKISVLIPGV